MAECVVLLRSNGIFPSELRSQTEVSNLNLSSRAKPRDLQCAPDGSPKLRVLTHAPILGEGTSITGRIPAGGTVSPYNGGKRQMVGYRDSWFPTG